MGRQRLLPSVASLPVLFTTTTTHASSRLFGGSFRHVLPGQTLIGSCCAWPPSLTLKASITVVLAATKVLLLPTPQPQAPSGYRTLPGCRPFPRQVLPAAPCSSLPPPCPRGVNPGSSTVSCPSDALTACHKRSYLDNTDLFSFSSGE